MTGGSDPDATARTILRLIRERDEARAQAGPMLMALQQIQQWDCLNPPQAERLADLPWLRGVVDRALNSRPVSGGEALAGRDTATTEEPT